MKSFDADEAFPTLHGRARRRWLSHKATHRKARVIALYGVRGVRA